MSYRSICLKHITVEITFPLQRSGCYRTEYSGSSVDYDPTEILSISGVNLVIA